MKFAYQAGLVLLMNLAVVSGGTLPGVGMPIEISIPQQQSTAQQALEKGLALFLKSDAASLKQAIPIFEEALKLSKSQSNVPLQASSLSYLGQVSYSLSNYQEAVKYYERSLSLHQNLSDRVNQAKVSSMIGAAYIGLGSQKKALDYYSKALPVLVENNRVNIGSELFTISTLQSMGSISVDLGQKQQGLDYYVQALDVARQGLRPWIVDALVSLVDVCLKIDEPKKAIDYSNQAVSLLEGVRNPTRKGKVFYQAGLAYAKSGEHQQALEYFNQALVIAREIKHEGSVTAILSAIESSRKDLAKSGADIKREPVQKDETIQALDAAQKLFMQGDKVSLTRAIPKLEKSLELSRQNRKPSLEIASLTVLGRVYDALLNQKKALAYFSQALVVARTQPDKSYEASISNYLGNAYAEIGESSKALEFYEKALAVWRQLDNKFGEAATLSNMGRFYSDRQDFPKALNFSQQALSRLKGITEKSTEMQQLEAGILATIGIAQANSGEIEKALNSYNQALSIVRANNQKSSEAVMLTHIARVYAGIKESQKALDLYNQALLINGVTGNELFEAKILNEIGLVSVDLQQYQKAADNFVKSAQIANRLGDRNGESATLNNLGVVYLSHLGARSAALEAFNQALPQTRTVGDKRAEASILRNIGAIYFATNREPEAFKLYEQVLSLYRATGNRSGESLALGNLAKFYQIQNKLPNALKNIDAAIDIVESLRSELKNDALKTSYFTSVQGHYQLKTDILMQLHQQQPTQGYDAQALETADQSRARVLRELLVQANANIKKDITPDLLKQEQTLNQTLNAKETQLIQLTSQPGKEGELAPLNQEIATLYAQRDDLKNTIRATNPAYANLQYPQPTTLAQIQQQLDPETLMLQYSLGEQESYLWVIGQTRLKTYILPKRTDIEKTATTFRKELTAKLTAPNSALLLTQQILTPAAGDLGNKRLVIIPDGILHTIPFAALNSPNSTTYNPLLTQHEITNLPSASTIGILRSTVATKPRGPKTLAILADPIFKKDDTRLMGKTIQASNNLDLGEQIVRGRAGRDLDLKRLPFTATEAKGILALVPNQDSTSAFGFDASYDWITNPKISQYRYVHLATHGFFDGDQPALSSIVLSSFDVEGRDRKAYLRFPDLFNLNLPAELVVLSACETGLGNNIPGEGLVGMTRGLMYAGALRVAVSLWAVDDQATSDLMQDFYKNLWQGRQSHAAALRQAQLTAWKQGKAPSSWAAFTLQGEWRN